MTSFPRTDSRKIDRLLARLADTNLDVEVEVSDEPSKYSDAQYRTVWIRVGLNTYGDETMLGVYDRSKRLHIGYMWDRSAYGATPKLITFSSLGWTTDEDLRKPAKGTYGRIRPSIRQNVAINTMVTDQAKWDARHADDEGAV
jgi:hypothetical protein